MCSREYLCRVFKRNTIAKLFGYNHIRTATADFIIVIITFVGQSPAGLIHPPNIFSHPPQPDDFLLPFLMIWNPVLTYNSLFIESGLRCQQDGCNKLAITKYWNDGSTSHKQPRTIHGITDIVLLVSAVYVCENGHKILAHDPRVLKMIPCTSMIPFVLLHQTGFTREFVDLISSLCSSGMNFHSLETTVKRMRWENYLKRKSMYQYTVDNSKKFRDEMIKYPVFVEFDDGRNHVPSNDIIAKCFLSKFLEDEPHYRHNIRSTDTGHALSFDHTFKIAANIGYFRTDKKWIPQYDSAFFVFNSQGNILSWQFTKGTCFNQVEPLLISIKKQAEKQGNVIETIYIDNCCQWKKLLQKVFGVNVKVKLDIFHAVQRITRHMSKRHEFYGQCVSDLRLAFRKKEDQGRKRTQSTPEPNEIASNLDEFIKKWRHINSDHGNILSSETIREVQKLKLHANKGCLSGIEVGGGTNRNEAFHRYIRNFFHKSRLGILLAYALMMLIVCNFNDKETKGNIGKSSVVSQPCTGEVDNNPQELIGIAPSDRIHGNFSNDNYTQDVSSDTIDADNMKHIITTAVSQYTLSTLIQQQTSTASNIFKYAPFSKMMSYQDIMTPNEIIEDEIQDDKCRLESTLKSWNFILEPVGGDGNCFFVAIALNILHNINNRENLMDKLNVNESEPISILVQKLREVLVQEWLGPNRCEYDFLCKEESYEEEAKKFLNDGYYASALGDSMPLAMANALKSNIVIFRSTSAAPVTYISPRESPEYIMFLAYTASGPGHYDSVLYAGTINDLQTTPSATKCRCGVNVKDKTTSACSHTSQRHSMCKCLAVKQPCSKLCGCKGCANPFGNRVVLGKRKREPHSWQQLDCCNASFILERGQTLTDGCWSDFETIVLINIIQYCNAEALATSADEIQAMYNEVVSFIHAPYCSIQLPPTALLRKKSGRQMKSKIDHLFSELNLVKQFQ